MGNSYHSNKGGQSGNERFGEGPKGKQKASAPSFKETPNPSGSVKKLKQVKGAEQG